ncbi:MAG: UbiA prenyltransferase family protein [Nanoarchaeota archaeon]|nr:UbiA prenyltransferase family protein [Nanoarchaeota archaeon]
MLLELLRVKQWYKNLVIFLPLIFAKEFFNETALIYTIIGFFALCLISSSNYIINDVIDREKDKKNIEKKLRPIASSKIKIWQAITLSILSLILGLAISLKLSLMFAILGIALFLLSQLYTFKLKNEAFADILIISTNFVIRAVAGAFVITNGLKPYVAVSPWLILCPFFFALFLVVIKRRSESFLKKSIEHRPVLKIYNEKTTSALMTISTALLIVSYSLYTFFSPYFFLFLTIPFVLYIIFRLFHLTEKGDEKVRHLELIYKDIRIVIPTIIIIIIAFLSIYL